MPAANVKLPAVDEGRDYYHVRIRRPSQFDTCRIPAWAQRASESISKGSKVVMCQKGNKWMLQSVQIKKGHGKTKRDAKRLATRIRDKLES